MGHLSSIRSRWLDIARVFFECLWTAERKEQGQYSLILTEQTWSIKELLCGFWGNFSSGIQRVVPIASGQNSAILPAREAQPQHRIRFVFPAH